MTETEQITETADTAVTDAPVSDTPASETDLDQLLAEFEAGTTKAPEQSVPDFQAEAAAERERAVAENLRAHTEALQLDSKRQELEQAQEYLRAQEDARDEIEAFRAIRGELDVTDEDLQGFIVARVLKDAAINQAWQNRREDRAAYNRMVARLNGDLQLHVEQQRQRFLSKEAAADHAAVAMAVRDSSAKRPPEPPPDFGRMSEAELHAWKRSNMPGY